MPASWSGVPLVDGYRTGAEVSYRTEGFGASASYRLDYDPDATGNETGGEQVNHTLGVTADGTVDRLEFGVALSYTSDLDGDDLRGTGRVASHIFKDGRIAVTYQGDTTNRPPVRANPGRVCRRRG